MDILVPYMMASPLLNHFISSGFPSTNNIWTAFRLDTTTTKSHKKGKDVNKIYCNLIVAPLCYHQMQLRWEKSRFNGGWKAKNPKRSRVLLLFGGKIWKQDSDKIIRVKSKQNKSCITMGTISGFRFWKTLFESELTTYGNCIATLLKVFGTIQ